MAKKEEKQPRPGSAQDETAPQDEAPGGRPENTDDNHDIGVVKRKPKPGEKRRGKVKG
jgi:hypothetical protein